MDEEWKPNEESLKQLLEMGISKEEAEEALRNTGNSSVVFAADYAFAKQEKMDPFLSAVYDISESCKMVFIVNSALGMSVGKTAAQVGHATLGLYQKLSAQPQYAEDLINWEDNGGKMVVLKGVNYQHLKILKKEAELIKLPVHCVIDAGHTEVESGSTTVLAIFGKESEVNNITGELVLL